MKKRLIFSIILLNIIAVCFAQELRLVVSNQPLNTVLNTLNVEISFDDQALSNYRVTVSQTFASPEDAIRFLLDGKPFRMEKIGNVFVISPVLQIENVAENVVAEKKYIMTGELYDLSTGEPLPYAHVQTGKGMITTNESGMFTLVQTNQQPVWMRIYYIGFETLDTTLNIGKHCLSLTPETYAIEDVIVNRSPTSMLMQSGKTSGEIRINHQIARYMPGSADNSVFTLLRMLPGVRASGEPSEDLIVCGSNWGESRLIFDGFTVFGMKSFNDQIGAVNPYMAKEIRLHKGGYDASHGNRTGAIAEITGNEGNLDKPSVKANLSNYTANIYASAPFKNSSALSVAYRQTFYSLYDNVGINIGNGHPDTTFMNIDSMIYINPKYAFRDLNLKYAGKTSGEDRYYVSLYVAEDHFKSFVTQGNLTVDAAEKNRQYGAAASYNRQWNNGSISKFLLSYSKFKAAIDNVSGISNYDTPIPLEVFHIDNSIQELSFQAEHHFNIGERQQVHVGGELRQYASLLNDEQHQINSPTVYITDNIMFGRLSLQAGVRAEWIPDRKIYVQPRVSLRYVVSDESTVTASFGLYQQFVSRIPYPQPKGYQMIWDMREEMFLSSIHFLAGYAYNRDGWLLSVEGYLKKNKNELYYIFYGMFALDNTFWGADVYLKKEWRKHTLFTSYSLVNTQTLQSSVGQEIKSGAIVSLKPFHFSTTYVYGAGFPILTSGSSGNNYKSDAFAESYSRLDLSLIYRLQLKNCRLQTGVSLLNVFDANNVKYSYRISDQNNVFNVYTKATSRTPVVFFEIIF